MIGLLTGIIREKNPPHLILDVHGVGYEIAAPMTTFYQLPEINETVTLSIHMVVREDAQLLYGFYNKMDRQLFRTLIKTNGVGPKLALTILSGMTCDEFIDCVHQNNIAQLTKVPGIGKKTAERLLIETRDAISKWQPDRPTNKDNNNVTNTTSDDACDALIALGYKPLDAKRAISKVFQSGLSSQELIRLALKQLAGVHA